MTGYYQHFVENDGAKAFLLTQLTGKDAFEWIDATQEAFEELKRAMVTLFVLVLPDFTQPFIVETDALGTSLGVVLSQQWPTFQSVPGSPSPSQTSVRKGADVHCQSSSEVEALFAGATFCSASRLTSPLDFGGPNRYSTRVPKMGIQALRIQF